MVSLSSRWKGAYYSERDRDREREREREREQREMKRICEKTKICADVKTNSKKKRREDKAMEMLSVK